MHMCRIQSEINRTDASALDCVLASVALALVWFLGTVFTCQ